MIYIWRKPSDGEDHFHMALCYLYLAVQLRGDVQQGIGTGSGMTTFKLDQPKQDGRQGTGLR